MYSLLYLEQQIRFLNIFTFHPFWSPPSCHINFNISTLFSYKKKMKKSAAIPFKFTKYLRYMKKDTYTQIHFHFCGFLFNLFFAPSLLNVIPVPDNGDYKTDPDGELGSYQTLIIYLSFFPSNNWFWNLVSNRVLNKKQWVVVSLVKPQGLTQSVLYLFTIFSTEFMQLNYHEKINLLKGNDEHTYMCTLHMIF